ncbi:MAG: aromatic amino acid transport family protein [Candidatus Spechtbacteria bacterium]|nr:aromatic amino acid transport family protein [Candidatus Spechtbacteria bacterium]
MDRYFVGAVASLVGTIVGAGIFGVPFVFVRAGFWAGAGLFVLLTALMLVLHLMYAEIVERTSASHREMGYARLYMGKKAGDLVALAVVLGAYGALIAYILIASEFLNILFGPLFSSNIAWGVIFWGVLSLAILKGLKTISRLEVAMLFLLMAVLGVIILRGLPLVNISNFAHVNWGNVLVPYGVILFSLGGFQAIPEMSAIFGKEKKNFKKAVITGILISAFLTFAFAFVVVGISGPSVSEEAIAGLIPFMGKEIVFAGAIFGILALATSYLVIGVNLKESFMYDRNIPPFWSNLLIIVLPMLLIIAGIQSFIQVISITGAVLGAVLGVMIALLFHKVKKAGDRKPSFSLNVPKPVAWIISIALIGGGIYEIINIGL